MARMLPKVGKTFIYETFDRGESYPVVMDYTPCRGWHRLRHKESGLVTLWVSACRATALSFHVGLLKPAKKSYHPPKPCVLTSEEYLNYLQNQAQNVGVTDSQLLEHTNSDEDWL